MSFSKCTFYFFAINIIIQRTCESKNALSIVKIDDKLLTTVLRQNILRDTYGDACMKVAIRKCFKALMEVNKKVCRRRFRCRKGFKSEYKHYAKIACLRGFDYSNLKRNVSSKVITNTYRFVDATRERFLDACIPHMVLQNKMQNNKKKNLRSSLEFLVKEILRDSSERRCKKLASQKCIKACDSAKNDVCAIHECGRQKKKLFRSNCRKECPRAFNVRRQSSSESSSDDSSSDK